MRCRISTLVFIAITTSACAGEAADGPRAFSERSGADSIESAAAADGSAAALWMRGRERAARNGRRERDCQVPARPSMPPPSTPEQEEPAACLFGEQFSDLRSHEQLTIIDEHWITTPTQVPTELEQAQLVLAVRQSSHDDVVSAEEALSRVDQQEIRRMDLLDANGVPAFTVYEYGVGDNSYGAIFVYETSELAASIHDGDLLDCQF